MRILFFLSLSLQAGTINYHSERSGFLFPDQYTQIYFTGGGGYTFRAAALGYTPGSCIASSGPCVFTPTASMSAASPFFPTTTTFGGVPITGVTVTFSFAYSGPSQVLQPLNIPFNTYGTVSGGVGNVSGTIAVLDSNGSCLWCENFAGLGIQTGEAGATNFLNVAFSSDPTETPEPATWAMIAVAGLGLRARLSSCERQRSLAVG